MARLEATKTFYVDGNPISKPRMTKADKWKKRPCVVEYRAWADLIRKAAGCTKEQKLNALEYEYVYCIFRLPVPPSASKKEIGKLQGTHHKVRPDLDNLVKGVLDALFENDSAISSIHAEKYYVIDGQREGVDISLLSESPLLVPL